MLRRRLSSSIASRLATSLGLSISPPMTMAGGAVGGRAPVSPSTREAGAMLGRRVERSLSFEGSGARLRPREEVELPIGEESVDGPGVGAAEEDARARSGEMGLSTVVDVREIDGRSVCCRTDDDVLVSE